MKKQLSEDDLLIQRVIAEEVKKFLDENRKTVLKRALQRLSKEEQ